MTALNILVVEDEALIAMMAEDMIEGLGHRVAEICGNVGDALAAVERGTFDCALLDVNLCGDSSMPIATALAERGAIFAFTTGYGVDGVDAAHRDRPVLGKPYALAELEALLDGFVAQRAGTSSITSSVDSKRG